MSRRRHPPEDARPSEGQRRSADWRRELDRLKTSLTAARPETGDRFHHAVLWIEGDLPEGVRDIHPRVFAAGRRVHRVIPVRSPAGGHLVHFVLDDNLEDDGGEELNLLVRVVRNIRRTLQGVPQRLLPTFTQPPAADGLEENFLTWVSLLHWLGHVEGNAAFRSKLEFLMDKDQFSTWATFTEWSRCSTQPDFDAVPFLTGTPAGAKTLAEWKAEHEAAGRRLPEVIAASLSKPLWQASANAVDQILLLDVRPAQRGAAGSARARSTKGESKRKDDADRDRLSDVIKVLYRHHRPTDPDQCDTALDQARIAKPLGLSASTISRRMAVLMKQVAGCQGMDPMEAYRHLCDSTHIHRELIRLRIKYVDEKLPRLFTRGNMDHLASAFENDAESFGEAGPD